MEPINFIENFKNEFFVKEYGVTEIFVFDGYLHVTSKWEMDESFYKSIEAKINELGTPCQL